MPLPFLDLSSDGMSLALQNPLILYGIFKSLVEPLSSDRREPNLNALVPAAKVSKKWNYEANKIIWHTPPIPALLRVEENLRQKLANFVQKLSFQGDEECQAEVYKALGSLKWPLLECLVFDASDENHPERLAKFIVPGLKELEIYGGPIDNTLLKLIGDTCVHLHSVTIDNPRQGISVAGVIGLIISKKDTLKKFVCLYGMEFVVKQETILALSEVDGLIILGLGGLIRSQWIPEHSFTKLTRLQLSIEGRSTGFIRSMKGLESILLVIDGDCSQIFTNLKVLERLHDVEVVCQHGTIRSDDLLSLGENNPKIQSLIITSETRSTILPATDKDIEVLVNSMPKLRVLHLKVLSGDHVTENALTAIAVKCPQLEDLSLFSGKFDLCAIPEPLPQFQNLEDLELKELTEGNIEQNVKVFQRLFPFVVSPFVESEGEWITMLKAELESKERSRSLD